MTLKVFEDVESLEEFTLDVTTVEPAPPVETWYVEDKPALLKPRSWRCKAPWKWKIW